MMTSPIAVTNLSDVHTEKVLVYVNCTWRNWCRRENLSLKPAKPVKLHHGNPHLI